MTLRELLMSVDLNEVYRLINKEDSKNVAACDRPSIKKTVDSYTDVVNELLSKPKVCAYKMDWVVKESLDIFDKVMYADVSFLNKKYIAPAKGLKPWGGEKGKKIPRGHYNCNDNKYNQYFACGFTPWSKIIDTPVINEAGYTLERVVAEILWEMTFYGWTEKKVDVHIKDIKVKIDKAMKQVKEGKCIELPSKKKGGYNIVIPDIVSSQIIDIANKIKKKKKK